MRKISTISTILGLLGGLVFSGPALSAEKTFETRIGTLTFDERGMPTESTSDLLFDWLDFQYGVQSFLWSLPYVGAQGWLEANRFHGATSETESIGHINGLSRIDILADCVDRARSTVEVSIY